MEQEWNNMKWQGRSKENIEFSTRVSIISMSGFIILLLISIFSNAQTLKSPYNETPTLNVFKHSRYTNTQNRFNQRSFIYLNRNTRGNMRTIVILPTNNRRLVYNNFTPVIYNPRNIVYDRYNTYYTK